MPTSLTPRSTPNVLIIDAEIISSGHACGVVIFRGGWWAPSSENRTDGLDFGCLYASQFDSKTSVLSWLSLDGANVPAAPWVAKRLRRIENRKCKYL